MPDPHIVRSLYWAKPCRAPRAAPRGLKGTKALGIAYERNVGKALEALPAMPKIHRGAWFEFCDSGVVRHCQPDIVMKWKGEDGKPLALVVEVKLTDTPVAYGQLRGLYFPVLEEAFGLPVRGVVVARRTTRASGAVYGTIREALSATAPAGIGLVHWLGTGPLW